MNFIKSHLSAIGKILLASIILFFLIYEGRHVVASIDIALLKKHFSAVSLWKIILMLLVGSITVVPMTMYDFIFKNMIKSELPNKKVFSFSYFTNTTSNLVGLGGVAGATLRTLLFSEERSKKEVIKTTTIIGLFFLSGLSILSFLFAAGILQSPIYKEYRTFYIGNVLMALYLPALAYMILKRRGQFTSKHVGRLIVASFLEWTSAFLALWFITVMLDVPIHPVYLLSIFVTGVILALVSMIPSGLGSFDFVVMLGFVALKLPEEQALLVLLFFRISYYLVPFLIGLVLVGREYWQTLNHKFNKLPELFLSRTSHLLLTVLIFSSGVILLISGALPGAIDRMKMLKEIVPESLLTISHTLSVTIGFVLLALSRGVEYRVKKAWLMSLVMLFLGAVFTFSKGFDYEEALFVSVVAIIMWNSQKQFYKENFVMTWGKSLFDGFVLLLFLGFYIVVGYANLPNSKIVLPQAYQQYMIGNPTDLITNALTGFLLALLLIYAIFFFSKRHDFPFVSSHEQTADILAHLEKYKGHELAHLIFLHDKYGYWDQEKAVFFSYQKYADKLIVLGNPIGQADQFEAAIEEFQTKADLYGYTTIFYQVSAAMLPFLHEKGFDFFKLGEEGFVHLNEFSLSGKRMKSLRALRNKLEKDGYTVEMVQPPFSEAFIGEMSVVSDQWLRGRKEKGFSLGYFDEAYLNLTPVAVCRDREQNLIGFATLMPAYDEQIISVDLMRYVPDAPSGLMDFLFIHLLESTKEQYEYFNMGMAPLSNVGISRFSFLGEKLASQLFMHGHFLYHFQGLRNFKNKYVDEWRPKYLAYRKKTSLPLTVLQISLLIAKRKKENENGIFKWNG